MALTPTPGPWRVTSDAGLWSASHDGFGSSCYQGILAGDVVVAIAVAHCSENFTNPDPRANAHLIAAAPDMLSALKNVAKKLGSRPYGTGSYLPKALRDEVLAAIAKAEGEVTA